MGEGIIERPTLLHLNMEVERGSKKDCYSQYILFLGRCKELPTSFWIPLRDLFTAVMCMPGAVHVVQKAFLARRRGHQIFFEPRVFIQHLFDAENIVAMFLCGVLRIPSVRTNHFGDEFEAVSLRMTSFRNFGKLDSILETWGEFKGP